MTEQVQTKPFQARPASDASERAASISTGAALGNTLVQSLSTSRPRAYAASVRPAPCIRRRLIMSSPAITSRTTEPVFSVARLMLESGVSGVPVLDAGGRPVGMVSDGDLLGRRGDGRLSPWLEMLAKRSPPPKSALERPVGEVMSAPPDHDFAECFGAGHRRDSPGASDQASAGAGRRRSRRRRGSSGPPLPDRKPASRSACQA